MGTDRLHIELFYSITLCLGCLLQQSITFDRMQHSLLRCIAAHTPPGALRPMMMMVETRATGLSAAEITTGAGTTGVVTVGVVDVAVAAMGQAAGRKSREQ